VHEPGHDSDRPEDEHGRVDRELSADPPLYLPRAGTSMGPDDLAPASGSDNFFQAEAYRFVPTRLPPVG